MQPGCSLWQPPSLNDAPLRTISWLPSMTACQVMMLPYGRHPGCSLWQLGSSYGAPLRTSHWLPPLDSPVQCGAPPNPGTFYLVHHLAALTHVAVHGRHLQTAVLARAQFREGPQLLPSFRSALGQAVAQCHTGAKPLPDLMLTWTLTPSSGISRPMSWGGSSYSLRKCLRSPWDRPLPTAVVSLGCSLRRPFFSLGRSLRRPPFPMTAKFS